MRIGAPTKEDEANPMVVLSRQSEVVTGRRNTQKWKEDETINETKEEDKGKEGNKTNEGRRRRSEYVLQ